jgi:exopolysaccharide biosynthesis polyprenyl glycosylphosphotransferase
MVVLFAYVFITGDGSGAHQISGLAVYALGLLAVGRLSASFALSHGLVERDLRRRTLILGAGKIGNVTARRLLAQPDLGLQPVGFLDDDPLDMPGETAVLPVLGGPPDLDRIVTEHNIDHFIVGFSMASHQLMLGLVRRCWELGVSVALVPRLFEVAGDRPAVDRLGGLPLVSLAAPPSRSIGLALKSVIDRAVAAVTLLLLSPLLASVALAIRLSMGSPVMYCQHRVGRDGAHFVLWKFRTMVGTPEADGEGNAEWAQAAVASAGDVSSFGGHTPGGLRSRVPASNRCTPLGSFLRRTSIDELPQLWNVLRGDMSLIGPRPEMPHYVERFEEAIYRYSDRHRVKSGLTGWAQVHGLRGDTSLTDRVEWDNYYIENWSPWLDFKITLRTVHCILRDAVDGRSKEDGGQCDMLTPVPHPTASHERVHES